MLYKNITRYLIKKMNVLTPDELAFLAKIERQRKKHAEAQALYRTKHQEELKVKRYMTFFIWFTVILV